MSKQVLHQMFEGLVNKQYSWSLYFFSIDRRGNNPYQVHKIRFRNDEALYNYGKDLAKAIYEFQFEEVENIEEYDGMNSKISCDKIAIDSELIAEQWGQLREKIISATDTKVNKKYQGYIVMAQPQESNLQPVTFIKTGNPVFQIKKNKSLLYKSISDDYNELDQFSDELYRLYLSTDIIVFNSFLYTFNHKFEVIFNLEKTFNKIKQQGIERIYNTDSISDKDIFRRFAASYKSNRTFITLNDGRIQQVSDPKEREKVANMLNIGLDEQGKLNIASQEEASLLIKFLCYKIFREHETLELLEAPSVSKLKVG